MSLLRQPILLLARSQGVKKLVSTMPVSSSIVTGYVPGETTHDAVAATSDLVDDGLRVTLDYLGEDTTDAAQADATVAAYKELLADLAAKGLAPHAEVSVKLSAI
ncbi:MAG TPA: proline dehydrogenase, partial [Nocardioides sp.]|nr:proline dehydrogenase [Nocardioides sp.]